MGSSRLSEVRVRVVSDSPLVALYFRNLLHRTPLYAPEAFPRTLTVYAATLAGEGVAAARAGGSPYTVMDVDPQTARGTVLAVGNVPLTALGDAVVAAAGQLALVGGYRHVPGGNNDPTIAGARAEGALEWYMRDRHYYAPAGEAHPDLLPIRADVVADADKKGHTLVVGAPVGSVAGPAAARGRLFAAHAAVWSATEGLASALAGVSVPRTAAAGLPLVRGAVSAQGFVTLPLAGPKAVAHPSRILVVGGGRAAGPVSSGEAVAAVKAAAGLTDKAAEKLAARIAAAKTEVTAVATSADALKALAL